MIDKEMLDAMQLLLKPINEKLEDMDLKIEQLRLDYKTTSRSTRKDINALNDQMETLIAVMEAKGILPKAE